MKFAMRLPKRCIGARLRNANKQQKSHHCNKQNGEHRRKHQCVPAVLPHIHEYDAHLFYNVAAEKVNATPHMGTAIERGIQK